MPHCTRRADAASVVSASAQQRGSSALTPESGVAASTAAAWSLARALVRHTVQLRRRQQCVGRCHLGSSDLPGSLSFTGAGRSGAPVHHHDPGSRQEAHVLSLGVDHGVRRPGTHYPNSDQAAVRIQLFAAQPHEPVRTSPWRSPAAHRPLSLSLSRRPSPGLHAAPHVQKGDVIASCFSVGS